MTTGTNDITELRDHLFDTLRGLKTSSTPDDLAKARAVAHIGQTIINSAIVEVNFLKATGSQNGSGFIPLAPPAKGGVKVIEERPGVRVTQHKLEG